MRWLLLSEWVEETVLTFKLPIVGTHPQVNKDHQGCFGPCGCSRSENAEQSNQQDDGKPKNLPNGQQHSGLGELAAEKSLFSAIFYLPETHCLSFFQSEVLKFSCNPGKDWIGGVGLLSMATVPIFFGSVDSVK